MISNTESVKCTRTNQFLVYECSLADHTTVGDRPVMFHTLFIKHPTQTDLSICTFNRNKRSILFSHSLLYLNIHPQSPWIQLLWWIPPLSLTYTGVINSSLHRQTNRQSYNITSTNPWFYRNQKQTLSDQSFVDINF